MHPRKKVLPKILLSYVESVFGRINVTELVDWMILESGGVAESFGRVASRNRSMPSARSLAYGQSPPIRVTIGRAAASQPERRHQYTKLGYQPFTERAEISIVRASRAIRVGGGKSLALLATHRGSRPGVSQ